MKQIILRDVKMMMFSFRFWAATGIIIVSYIASILFNIWKLNNIQVTTSAWSLFIIGNIKSNAIMCFLAPFIPALAFGPVVIDDIQVGAYGEIVKKTGLKKYCYARSISSLIAGSSVFLLAFMIILTGCFIFSSSDAISNYSPMGLFKEVYYYSIPLYILLFILHSMLFGAIYALFGAGIAIITKSYAMALVLPGIVYNCARFAGMIFDNTVLYQIELLFPFLTYEFGSVDIPLWQNLLDLGIVLLLAVVLIIIGYKRLKNSLDTVNSLERGAVM